MCNQGEGCKELASHQVPYSGSALPTLTLQTPVQVQWPLQFVSQIVTIMNALASTGDVFILPLTASSQYAALKYQEGIHITRPIPRSAAESETAHREVARYCYAQLDK